MDDIPALISTLGFPIAVVCYLLWERHSATCALKNAIRNELVGAITELKVEIIKLSGKMGEGKN